METVNQNDGFELHDAENGEEFPSSNGEPTRNGKKKSSDEISLNKSKNKDTAVNVDDNENDKLETGDSTNILSRTIQNLRDGVYKFGLRHKKVLKSFLVVTLFLLYNAYLVGAIYHSASNGYSLDWCNGLGFLLILTFVTYWSLFYYFILKKYAGKRIQRLVTPLIASMKPITDLIFVRIGFAIIIVAGIITFLVLDSKGQERRLISALGVIVIVIICLLVSKHPGKVIWRQVFWGLALQFIFALAILRWDGGKNVMDCISGKVTTFLGFANSGSSFIYSYLVSGSQNVSFDWNTVSGDPKLPDSAIITLPGVFVFQALSVIYFFGFVVSLLFHLGAMTWVVSKLGWFLQITIGTTAAESMSASANIFLGQTEAPLLIQPYLPEMTKSELHAIMTGGFSTIAGSVMAAYIAFGINASYLLSASVMAAPAALGLSKLVYPETEKSRTTADRIKEIQTTNQGNALDAAAQGAIQGVMLIGCIVANLIAFISFVTFLNTVISWFGGLVGADYLSFEWILSKLFIPFAWVIGVHWEECEDVALLLGLKIVVNEFVAYERLVTTMSHLSDRSKGIATYALCSFANFSSIGIQLGGLGALAPSRREDLANIIWRSFIAGTAAGLLNGCIAGTLLTAQDYQPFNGTTTVASLF